MFDKYPIRQYGKRPEVDTDRCAVCLNCGEPLMHRVVGETFWCRQPRDKGPSLCQLEWEARKAVAAFVEKSIRSTQF